MNSLQTIWDGEECNRFIGSDSTVFPPFSQPDDGLWAFTPDICMSMKAVFVQKSTYAGLPTSRYTIDFGDLKVNCWWLINYNFFLIRRLITEWTRQALFLSWSPWWLSSTRNYRFAPLRRIDCLWLEFFTLTSQSTLKDDLSQVLSLIFLTLIPCCFNQSRA